MADEIPNTPVPVPTYGQPASSNASVANETASVPPPPGEAATTTIESVPKDVAMTDVVAASTEQAPSPAPATSSSTNAPSPAPAPAPARTGTPLRGSTTTTAAAANGNNNNGNNNNGNNNNGNNNNGNNNNGNNNGGGGQGQENYSSSSRAASQHPDPGFTMPAEAPPHGAPVRQYLNSKVTGTLLEGMKVLAKEQPKDPLRVLGEYLLQRSKELET
ncbi:hypothetical protein F4809DRAFT_204529 [Biscogniauxia mediterranea]|nr:hypothetical protein F4809DRAFT_204529 [Biscogniauxia mediterranea]